MCSRQRNSVVIQFKRITIHFEKDRLYKSFCSVLPKYGLMRITTERNGLLLELDMRGL